MLYTNDGTLAIDDRPAPRGLFAEERRAARERREQLAGIYEEMRQMAEEISAIEEAANVELETLGCVWPEDEEPMRIDTREDAHAFLTARVDVLDEECEESGVEDALDWERWNEFEDALYALAEFECAR